MLMPPIKLITLYLMEYPPSKREQKKNYAQRTLISHRLKSSLFETIY